MREQKFLMDYQIEVLHLTKFDYPGTDDGKTFKSPNIKSVPQQPIRNITTNTHKLGSFPGQGDRGVTQPFGQIEIQLMQTFGECNGKPGRPPFPEKCK